MDIDDVLNAVLGLISQNISMNSEEKILFTNESKKNTENILDFLENTIKKMRKNFNIKLIARELLYKTIHENFILTIINNAHYTDVRRLISTLDKESFLLTIIETKEEDNAISVLTSVGLNVVLKIKIALCRTALLLHKERNLGKTVVVNNHANCLDRLKICLQDLKYDNVIFVVNTIIDNDIFEILRDIKGEPGYKKLQILDLQDAKAPKFSLQNEFYESQVKLNLRETVLAPNGVWGTYRWMPLRAKSTSSMRWQAKINKSGSLVWMEKLPLIKEKNNRIVNVKCSAFDLGVYEYLLKNDVSLESQISIAEYSGTDEKGRRVVGLVDNFTISNEISADPDFTWIIPDIHYGASDVGQTLINLSLSYNFDVYTTYETEAEKRVIESMRPRLPQSNIIKVKDYRINIMNITKGKGPNYNPLPLSNFTRLISVYSYCLQDLIKLAQKKEGISGIDEKSSTGGFWSTCKKKKYSLISFLNFSFITINATSLLTVLISLEKIEWMIEQGTRKFIIVSNMSNRGSENLVLKWREYGATIIVRQEVDLSKATSFDKIFKEALTIAQLDDSSVIAVRQILTDNSPNDDEKNIFIGETDDEQRIDEGNPQDEEIRQFEQYLYN
ncbi:hypothetical protein M0802_015362 [Mischocyttarus mexicanus]|nr:hypothetical protein M0802_015362 [Mischocyttarus mexicanus]